MRLITYRQLHSQCASESLKCWERDCRNLCLCMFVLFVLDHLLWNCLYAKVRTQLFQNQRPARPTGSTKSTGSTAYACWPHVGAWKKF